MKARPFLFQFLLPAFCLLACNTITGGTAAPSPTARPVAALPDDGPVITVDSLATMQQQSLLGRDDYTDVAWSWDSKLLAAATESTIYLYDIPTLTEIGTVPDGVSGREHIFLGPDHELLAVASFAESSVSVWNIESAELAWATHWREHEEPITNVYLTFDWRAVAWVAGDLVQLTYLESGEKISSFEHGVPVTAVDISLNASKMAVGTAGGHVSIWDLQTHEEKPTILHEGAIISVHIPTIPGDFMAASQDNHVKLWGALFGQERLDIPLSELTEANLTFAVLSTGRNMIAAGFDNGEIWLIEFFAGESQRLDGHQTAIKYLTFSLDGRFLASVDEGGAVRIWGAR